MNQTEKEQIINLRKQGYGYKRIATELAISVNIIKSFCRNHQLSSVELHQTNQCKQCGKDIIPSHGRRAKRFCCVQCKQKWWNAHRGLHQNSKQVEMECVHCHQVFKSYPYEKRKYCSHACYIASRFGGGEK